MIIENELVKRVLESIDAEDARAVEIMASGNLTDYAHYLRSAGYRKALADCKTLITQTLEDVMKE